VGESQGGAYLPPELQDTMTEALRTYPSASPRFRRHPSAHRLLAATPAAQRPHDHQPSEPIVRGVLTIIGLLTSSAYHIGNRLTGRAIVDGEQELVRRQVAQSGRSQPAVHQGTQRPDGAAD
jgi:hypothetical protein